MKYQQFVFESYEFDKYSKTLVLHYGYDDKLHFTETFGFDFEFVEYDDNALDRACQLLFLTAGVSYYKMYLAPKINTNMLNLSAETASFLDTTYQKGLGEFFYTNGLDPQTNIRFPQTDIPEPAKAHTKSSGLLVGIGGGKDSLVSIDLLRKSGISFATWSLNHRAQLTPLIERIGSKHYYVERSLDPQLATASLGDAYNGHIPISAIFACVGTVVAILTGHRDVVVSNEHSANEPTLEYNGIAINHQYSKSQEFEELYQAQLVRTFGDSQRYYSLLRPLGELRIAELFSRDCFDKFYDVFSSCNHAFSLKSTNMFWDETCPKCCFVYLALFPFLGEERLHSVFQTNPLRQQELVTTYKQLLGITPNKPLECVGEIQESRTALRLCQKDLPELADIFTFEDPSDYNFRTIFSHSIPQDIWEAIKPLVR